MERARHGTAAGLQVADRAYDVGVGHVLGRIGVLVDGEDARVAGLLRVKGEEVGGIAGEENAPLLDGAPEDGAPTPE